MKVNQSMGALNYFWNAKEVDTRAKYLIYSAITINLLLWRCESWALTRKNLKKFEVIHLRLLRKILGIRWSDVMDEKIKNSTVCRKFNIIGTIEEMIAKRRWKFIGRVISMSEEKIPARDLSAWCNLKRHVGRPNISTRFSLLQDIGKIIPNVSKDGSF